MFLGCPRRLFTTDMPRVPALAFQRFFDNLSPTFGHMISLGQSNTIISCPALTTHSELNEEALAAAGIHLTTIRFAVGDEDPSDLIQHFIDTARLTIDPELPGFSSRFPSSDEIVAIIRRVYPMCMAGILPPRPRRNISRRPMAVGCERNLRGGSEFLRIRLREISPSLGFHRRPRELRSCRS